MLLDFANSTVDPNVTTEQSVQDLAASYMMYKIGK